MQFKHLGVCALTTALVLLGVAVPAVRADGDVSFGAGVVIGDDQSVYLAVTARYFNCDARHVADCSQRVSDPDDLAVLLFLSNRCGKSCDALLALRFEGLSWFDISLRFGLARDIWFVPVKCDPRPPYGKAYGHWKKHRQDPKYVFVLDDAEVRNLLAVRMAHEYYGVSIEIAMESRAAGGDLRTLLAREYRKRHGKGDKPAGKRSDKDGDSSKGHGKNSGKGKEKS
ncbi:MAG: hypothetical protein ACKVX7_05705 [Planctomycetota bacterium]